MDLKKRFILFSVQFPIMLLVGILLSFGYSLKFSDEPGVDWLMAVALAVALWAVVTFVNKRDEHRHANPQ